MANGLEHLHIGVWSYLDGSVDERVSRLYAPKWVAYSRGNQALARMEHLLNHPPSGRMPCMLLSDLQEVFPYKLPAGVKTEIG